MSSTSISPVTCKGAMDVSISVQQRSLPPTVFICDSIYLARGTSKVGQLVRQRYTDTVMTSTDALCIPDEGDKVDLRRIQVTVNVSQQQLTEFDSSSDLAEVLLPNVLQKIQEIAAGAGFNHSSSKVTPVEEVYQLELKPNMSLRVARPSSIMPAKQQQDFSNALSPEKTGSSYAQLKRLQPSPVRKLVLGSTAESEEDDEESDLEVMDDTKSSNWKIVSVTKLSEFNVNALIEVSRNKVVLNVVFNVLERIHPASPTTGLRMPPTSAPIAQMSVAKGGFALVPLDGGLLSVGGYMRDGVLSSAEFYDSHFNCWNQREELSMKRARFAAVECNGVPYIIGGSDGKNELGSVEIYRTKSCTWEKNSARMVTPRSCFDAAAIDGRIYAIGGVYYSTPLKSAEVFDLCLQKWRLIPGMHTSRYGLSVAACCGKLYAIGGQTLGWSTLATVECYDPKTTTWYKVASMKTPRRNAASVSINGKIYVFGGYNGSTAVNLVEVYDPQENIWRCLSPMCTKRSSASAVHINGSVFVAGGYSGTSFLNSVERYDIKTNQWSSRT